MANHRSILYIPEPKREQGEDDAGVRKGADMAAEVIALHKEAAPVPRGEAPLAFPQFKTGVLLVNLGTPDATDYWSMRRYLKEFLSDRRVIETSRWLWWPLLNLVILSTRPQRKGRDYEAFQFQVLHVNAEGRIDDVVGWFEPHLFRLAGLPTVLPA